VVDIPARALAAGEGAPVYEREARKPAYVDELHAFDPSTLPQPGNLNDALCRLLGSPNIASKAWVYEQYDTMVRTNSVVLPGGDAAVIRIKGTRKALAVKTDCNGRYVYLNPRRGAQIAVAEAARNVVCTGAKPVAITNCLNFGNPYKPESFWQFREAVLGMGEACRALETPVTGGNVSFYNENPEGAIYPTPVIGMLGVLEDVNLVTRSNFPEEGLDILLLGQNRGEVGGSEYLFVEHGKVAGDAPSLDLSFEKRLQETVLEAIRRGWVRSAHDTSEGGLAVALAECCIMDRERPVGASIQIESRGIRPDFLLFGEDQSRIILSCKPEHVQNIVELGQMHGVPVQHLGKTGGDRLVIGNWVDLPLTKLAEIYYTAIPNAMEIPVGAAEENNSP
jgi:phosphoribosylformylglycinamidine synthase